MEAGGSQADGDALQTHSKLINMNGKSTREKQCHFWTEIHCDREQLVNE